MLNINIYNLLIDITLITIFIFPNTLLETIQLPIGGYFFMFWVIILYGVLLVKNKCISFMEICVIIIAIAFSAANLNPSFLHLISIALAYRMLKDQKSIDIISRHLYNSVIVYVCLAFVIFYSLLYFGNNGRYMSIGIQDPNTTGLAVFCLFVIIRCRNKYFGNILLLCGILTFSRTYLLAILVFYSYEYLKKTGRDFKLNYVIVSVVGILALIGISGLFIAFQDAGEISSYASGFNRFSSVMDYSNYFRFLANTNLINIYIERPDLLLTGMTDNTFIDMNAIYSSYNDLFYRAIKPHNYFFSYFQIYGIWCIIIFYLTYQVFKLLINKKTNGCAMVIFIYLMILSLGAANYWLFLSISMLMEVNYTSISHNSLCKSYTSNEYT